MKYEIVLAEFNTPQELYKVAKNIANCGYTKFDTYSPFPIHGMDDAMKMKPSILGWIVLVGGFLGISAGFGMQTFMSLDYKLIISGKPFFSYPAFITVTFEIMVLFSAFATVFGMFALNKLPQHYHPLFKSDRFRKATSHGFFIGIESTDPGYHREKIVELMESFNCSHVDIIEDDQ